LDISLDAWYPFVRDLVPTPETVIIHAGCDMAIIAYGDEADAETEAAFENLVAEVRAAGERLGWPVFLRSGYGSDKHGWSDTCFVPDHEAVPAHLGAIIEWSELADIMGLPTDVWAVREMLDVPSSFRAFRGGMPISRERRYFVVDGSVVGHHPYWPHEAFTQDDEGGLFGEAGPGGEGLPSDWRALLDALNAETPEEVAELTSLTETVGRAVPGAWSVDWLWAGRRGNPDRRWFLTDMAWAERSFVWWDHPSAPPRSSFGGEGG
jgi:hypothetical protein